MIVPVPRAHRLRLALAAVVAAGAVAVGAVPPAGALPPPDPVTDYAAYPAEAVSGSPEACLPSDFTGVSYSLNDGPEAATLGDLGPLRAGDRVRWLWRGTSIRCLGGDVSLAIKRSVQPFFVASDDQALMAFALAVPADRGFGTLTLVLPDLAGAAYQIDAVIGLPLAVVGPSGSYYSGSLRGGGRDMLVGAVNGALGPPAAQPPVVPPVVPPAPDQPTPPAPDQPAPPVPDQPTPGPGLPPPVFTTGPPPGPFTPNQSVSTTTNPASFGVPDTPGPGTFYPGTHTETGFPGERLPSTGWRTTLAVVGALVLALGLVVYLLAVVIFVHWVHRPLHLPHLHRRTR